MPIVAKGPIDIQLLATWSFNHRQAGPVRSTAHALEEDYSQYFANTLPVIVLGDFNNSVIWDTQKKPHQQQLLDYLSSADLTSTYHTHSGETHGAETQPTLWMYRHAHRPYHIDFCFLPEAWMPYVQDITVGDHETWSTVSDQHKLNIKKCCHTIA